MSRHNRKNQCLTFAALLVVLSSFSISSYAQIVIDSVALTGAADAGPESDSFSSNQLGNNRHGAGALFNPSLGEFHGASVNVLANLLAGSQFEISANSSASSDSVLPTAFSASAQGNADVRFTLGVAHDLQPFLFEDNAFAQLTRLNDGASISLQTPSQLDPGSYRIFADTFSSASPPSEFQGSQVQLTLILTPIPEPASVLIMLLFVSFATGCRRLTMLW